MTMASSTTTAPSGAKTNVELTQVMFQMQAAFKELQLELTLKNQEIAAIKKGKILKVPPPEAFDGKRNKLRGFITQSMAYLSHNTECIQYESDKVRTIAQYLKDEAYDWFEPRLRDFLENGKDCSHETQEVFSSYPEFVKQLKDTYGVVDEEREAARQLRLLFQKGSAGDYVSKFRQITSKLEWDDAALMDKFHDGLKEDVKDAIALTDWPEDLTDLITLAVKIDNRLYVRRQAKKGKPSPGTHANHGRPRTQGTHQKQTGPQQWGDPMELDNINKDTSKKDQRKHGIPLTDQQQDWKKQGACLKCGKQGHFARDHQRKELNVVKRNSEVKETFQVVPHVELAITVNQHPAIAMIDSGAQGNFIATDTVKELGLEWDTKMYPYKISGADGQAIGNGTVTAETKVMMAAGDHKEEIVLDIVPMDNHQVVLGTPWLGKHNPIIDWVTHAVKLRKGGETSRQQGLQTTATEACTIGQIRHEGTEEGFVIVDNLQEDQVPTIPQEYQDLAAAFEEPGDEATLPEHQPWDCEIVLREDKQPERQPIYQLSPAQQETLREYIEKNLKRGFIRKSTSPAGYPVLFVPKPGGKQRLCVDYRKLNDITIKNSHALPRIDELQDTVSKATVFTKLDISEAYYSVRMKEGEEWKTAFRTGMGHFEYLVMPFGLTNAPGHYQALMLDTLWEYLNKFVVAYLDDVLIYSQNKGEHTEHVRKVIQALGDRGLRIKLEKCEFSVTKTEYLGHIIEPGRISMDPKKIESVKEWPQPTTVKGVQSFLGFANYYRRFIKGYSDIARPMTMLTKKEQPFVWGPDQQAAFHKLREMFSSEPILQLFDEEKPSTVESDASDYAIAACLSQPDAQGRLHPVMYLSRSLQPAEINYDVHDKELLAIVEAFKAWRVYLHGSKHQISVITDHRNLTFFTTTKQLSPRQVRWAEQLGYFNFKITYRKGSENARADALSRREDYKQIGPRLEHQLLKEEGDGLVYANPQIMTIHRISGQVDQELIKAYEKDAMYQELKQQEEPYIHTTAEGYLRYYGKVYVPARQVKRIIEQNHDLAISGHQGFKKTHDRIKQRYYFPQMKQVIRKYIDECHSCAINKASRHAPYGEMGITHPLSQPWERVHMDWITKLPKSIDPMTGQKFDSIWVTIEPVTKYAKFIPYLESSPTEGLVYMFNREIVADHGMPKEVRSDRDKWLTSKFWTSLMKQLGIKQVMTTAYHPQANGQAERTNQTLEQYLRHYLNYKQNNWVELLPIAQYAYNSAVSESTGFTPYQANYGFTPTIMNEPRTDERPAQTALERSKELKEIHEQLTQDLQFIAYRMAKYYNNNRSSAPTFREGENVYLIRRNIKTKRPSMKLDHVKIGPFKILEKIGKLSYRLQLPKGMRTHPVFHVSLLEKASQKTPIQTRITTDPDEDTYEVERILDRQRITNKNYYLIKWAGYSSNENTWEPEENLTSCQELVQEFQQREAEEQTNQQAGQRARTGRSRNLPRRQQVQRFLMIRREPFEHRPPPASSQDLQSTITPDRTSHALWSSEGQEDHEDEQSGQTDSEFPQSDETMQPLRHSSCPEGPQENDEFLLYRYQVSPLADINRKDFDKAWRKMIASSIRKERHDTPSRKEIRMKDWALRQLISWNPDNEAYVESQREILLSCSAKQFYRYAESAIKNYILYHNDRELWKESGFKDPEMNEEKEQYTGLTRALANLQSALEMTSEHFRPNFIHLAQRPDSSETTHSTRTSRHDLQDVEGGIACSPAETREDNVKRRRLACADLDGRGDLGMVNFENAETGRGDHLPSNTPRDDGSRDESLGGRTQCNRPNADRDTDVKRIDTDDTDDSGWWIRYGVVPDSEDDEVSLVM